MKAPTTTLVETNEGVMARATLGVAMVAHHIDKKKWHQLNNKEPNHVKTQIGTINPC